MADKTQEQLIDEHMIKAIKEHAASIDLSYNCCKILNHEEGLLIISLRRWP